MTPPAEVPAGRAGGGRRLAIWYAVVLAAVYAALIATAMQSYREIDRELTSGALSRRAAVAQLAAATLSEKLARLRDVAHSLATRVRFRELVAEGRFEDAGEILRDVPADFPFVERLFLTDPTGVLRADVPELPGVRGSDFSHREWYQGVSRNWRPYVSPIYRRQAVPRRDLFAVAAPVRDAAGQVSGILVLQVRLDTFFAWVRGIEFDKGETVYVVDQKGRIAFHSERPDAPEMSEPLSDPVVERLLGGAEGVEISVDAAGAATYVSAFAPVATGGWGVLARQPAASALAEKNLQLHRLQVAYGLALLLSVTGVVLVWQLLRARRRAEFEHHVNAELERLVRERTAQLETSNADLESFSYSVSHDLRAPLRAVDGYLGMLEEDHGEDLADEVRRLIGAARRSCARTSGLIDDLLTFARLGRRALQWGPIDMTALVREVYEEFPPDEKGVVLEVGDLPSAWGDRALVARVWSNLLSNARKFSSRRPAPRIEVSGRTDGGESVYVVRDNGAGFDMQGYGKLFGVFQRLHSAGDFPGTGIGLANVQRIVVRHGGRVWAEGTPGEGAAFYFTLPREFATSDTAG